MVSQLVNMLLKIGVDKVITIILRIHSFPFCIVLPNHAPHLMKAFFSGYQSDAYLRDEKGRTLHQDMLKNGSVTFKTYPLLFINMSEDQVREIDAGSALYPFVVKASGKKSDISKETYFLR